MNNIELSSRGTRRSRRLAGLVAAAVLEDAPLLMLVLGFVLAGAALHTTTGYPTTIDWLPSIRLFGLFAMLYAFGAFLFLMAYAVVRRKKSLRHLTTWTWIVKTLFPPGKTLHFVILIVGLSLLMAMFVAFKESIPIVHPFAWDAVFMRWDRVLHFGRHPFALLQPILGHPDITALVDRTYFSWIHVMWVTVIWQAWHGSHHTIVRSQFLFAFVLSWILLGTALATIFSSAGPAFYASVSDGPDPYAPLLAYLHSVNGVHELRVLRIQDLLWSGYVSSHPTRVGGISAMPSMHVAVVSLLTLLGFSLNQWLGWAYAAFGFVILVGSVHLGWHYAIDGYVSIVLGFGIWRASGQIVSSWQRRGSQLLEH